MIIYGVRGGGPVREKAGFIAQERRSRWRWRRRCLFSSPCLLLFLTSPHFPEREKGQEKKLEKVSAGPPPLLSSGNGSGRKKLVGIHGESFGASPSPPFPPSNLSPPLSSFFLSPDTGFPLLSKQRKTEFVYLFIVVFCIFLKARFINKRSSVSLAKISLLDWHHCSPPPTLFWLAVVTAWVGKGREEKEIKKKVPLFPPSSCPLRNFFLPPPFIGSPFPTNQARKL